MSQVYLEHSLAIVPRYFSLVDRDSYSPTCGCFDRLFWGWKLKDFPDATLQRAVYPLSILWDLDKSPHYHSVFLEKIIQSGILYWSSVQHKNGSVDQAFPNEFSFGASAFSLCDIIKAYKIIQTTIPDTEKEKFLWPIQKCCDFLVRSKETHGLISNHLAGAVLALLEAHQLFQNEDYLMKAQSLLDIVISNQSPEGWYVEYEGFDPGYQTLATFYLAQCWQLLKDAKLLNSLESSISFLAYFIHPDGTLGGSYGSRNTEIYYPGGIEILREEIPQASCIADKMINGIENKRTVQLSSLDDGNLTPLLSNYLAAFMASSPSVKNHDTKNSLPCDQFNCKKYFPEAQLYVISHPKYYGIFGVSKGGVLKIFHKQKQEWVWDDGGYIGQTKNGDLISSQMISNNPFVMQDNNVELKTSFYQILNAHPTPFKFLILRMLNLTLMQSLTLGNLIKDILVKLLISGKKKTPLSLKRRIIFEDNKILIRDEIEGKHMQLKWLKYGFPFTTIHMASSKYFQESQQTLQKEHEVDVSQFNNQNKINITIELDF